MKLPIRLIAFPVDFSHRSRLAAPYVKDLAARYGAKVLALHVVDPGDVHPPEFAGDDWRAYWKMHARTRLEHFVHHDLPGIEVEQVIEEGNAGRTIAEVAHRRGVDWIMMPTHGFSAFRRFALGSVTARVLHEAHCPVWTAAIHEDGQDAARCQPREVVAAVALNDSAEHVIRYAADIAADNGALLTVAHVTPAVVTPATEWAGGDVNDKIAHEACHALGTIIGRLDVKAHLAVRNGDVERALRQIALEKCADLLVIARGALSENTGRLRAHSYGIVNEAPCPVLSV